MSRKKRYIARLNEVKITRQGESALIDYREPGIPGTQLNIGPEIERLTDEEILQLFNDTLRAQAQLAARNKHVAVEVPLGSAQLVYLPQGDQWTPRGSVLRCLIESDEVGNAVIHIDDEELSAQQFGRLLTSYAGWGMRIEFVPEDETHRRPALEVRDPDREEK